MREQLRAEDPQSVGPYTLHGRLGEGRMGVLFFGRSEDGRKVALRTVRPQFAADPSFRQRLAREASALRQVTGPALVPLVESGFDGDPLWLASTYLPGPSLADAVNRYGPWQAETVRSLGASLVQGLSVLHDRGLAHRDLTPRNVILTKDGPRLVDFGIAGVFDSVSRTVIGTPMGTPPFLPPERFNGQGDTGPAGDVFVLGLLLAYTATGGSPFGGGDPSAVLRRVLNEEPDLSLLSPSLHGVVSACLAKHPAARPVLRDLHGALASAGPLTSQQLPPQVVELVASQQPEVRQARPKLLQDGLDRFRNGDLDGARALFQHALSSGDDLIAPLAMNALGLLESSAGNIDAARHWYQRSLAVADPSQARETLWNLARLEKEEGNGEAAYHWLQQLIATGGPEHLAEALRDLAGLEAARGDLAAARHRYQQAVATGDPDQAPGALADLAELEAEEGNTDVARHWYRQAIATGHPDAAPDAMIDLANLERNEGNTDAARHWYRQAIESGHDLRGPAAMIQLGLMETIQGNDEASRHWYELTVRSGSPLYVPMALVQLGMLEERRGDFGSAYARYRQVVDLDDPDCSPEAMRLLGSLAEAQGDPNAAHTWYLHAVKSAHPDEAPGAMADLGLLYASQGSLDEALEWLEEAAATGHPEHAERAIGILRELAGRKRSRKWGRR
ncbi:tetratricopeptide repeat protein [Actinocorallia sp. B10E7]|uniref:protein kinase domain-containing protein n=1 Tax=Actinocorallia sp. B10E7 TaxID=3153558 RepID=UPI00325D7FEC